jgi:hypothetical protein
MKKIKNYRHLTRALIGGAIGMVAAIVSVHAGTDTMAPAATDAKDAKAVAPAPAAAPTPSLITGDFGVTILNQYNSRGFDVVDRGVQSQPYADLYFDAYEGDGFLTSIKPTIGLWSNIESQVPSSAGGLGAVGLNTSTKYWEEFDWTPGVAFVFAKKWTLTETYLEFDGPNGVQQKTARSLNSTIAFDDSNLIDKSGNFSFQPHFTFLTGLGGQSGAGLSRYGNYFEIGISPTYTILKKFDYPLTLGLPVTVGLGDDRFYGPNKVYGYSSVALTVATPLAFIPAGFGSWTGTASVKYLNQGTGVAYVNPESTNPNQFIAGFSIGATF